MSNKTVPTISSGTPGPLGVLHLPRLWQKMILGAHDQLADEYKNCGPGFDLMALDALGVDAEALIAFVKAEKPTYVQFEKFIAENATKLNPTTVSEFNAAVVGYTFDEERKGEILAYVGLDSATANDAVNLNNLDDWQGFHESLG